MSVVSLTAAKQFLQVTHDEQDDVISSLLESADNFVESVCGIHLSSETVTEYHNGGSRIIRPNRKPVVTIRSIYDMLLKQTLSSDDYVLHQNSIYRKDGMPWDDRYPGRWRVTYDGGYSTTTIPAGVTLGILHLVYHWYWNRGGKDSTSSEGVSASWQDLPGIVRAYLGPYRAIDVEVC